MRNMNLLRLIAKPLYNYIFKTIQTNIYETSN